MNHIEILKSGVEKWNVWRNRNPGTRLDLRGAVLCEANLDFANLSDADLRCANLSGANLSEADLNGANLRWANLCGADLRWANLSEANLDFSNLRGANLRCANLSDANLSDADLSEADLNGTDLREANLCGAKFNWANLREANGVTVRFRDPRYEKEGYQLVAWTSEGEPWFNSGCRSFNKKDALEHWGSLNYPDKERGQLYVNAIKGADNE
jgi:uncharacterized protein YjbI with pentapeptide repeats